MILLWIQIPAAALVALKLLGFLSWPWWIILIPELFCAWAGMIILENAIKRRLRPAPKPPKPPREGHFDAT